MATARNVRWFEVLLYVALALDAISVVFQDRIPTAGLSESANMISTACIILLQVYFVWLAAQRRKSWPRWALAAVLVLAVFSLVEAIGGKGIQLSSTIEVMSCGGLVFFIHNLVGSRIEIPSAVLYRRPAASIHLDHLPKAPSNIV
jgi:hypothetical protein